jgi:hypothetical protein
MDVPPYTGSVVLSQKLLSSPPLNHRYKPVGFQGSDLPITLHYIVCYRRKRKSNAYIKRKAFDKMTQVSDVAHGPLVFCLIQVTDKLVDVAEVLSHSLIYRLHSSNFAVIISICQYMYNLIIGQTLFDVLHTNCLAYRF